MSGVTPVAIVVQTTGERIGMKLFNRAEYPCAVKRFQFGMRFSATSRSRRSQSRPSRPSQITPGPFCSPGRKPTPEGWPRPPPTGAPAALSRRALGGRLPGTAEPGLDVRLREIRIGNQVRAAIEED